MPTITFFISFSDAFFSILLYGVFIRNRHEFKMRGLQKIDFLLLGLVIIGAVSSFFSTIADVSWFWFSQLLKDVLLFYLAQLLGSKDLFFLKITLIFFVFFSSFNATLILYQKYHGSPIGFAVEDLFYPYGNYADESSSLYRPAGTFSHPNLAATMLSVALPAAFLFTFSKKSPLNKKLGFLLFLGLIAALICTASRAVWIVSAGVLCVIFFCLKKKNLFNQEKINLKKFLPVILLLLFLISPFVISRLASLPSTLIDERGGFQYRLHHLLMAKDLTLEQPFGVGLNVFPYIVLNKYDPFYYFSDFTPPHNLFAEVGSSFGIVGLTLFCLLIIEIVAKSLKIFKDISLTNFSSIHITQLVLIFSLLAFFLNSQFYPWLFSPIINGIVWVFMGFLYANQSSPKTKKN